MKKFDFYGLKDLWNDFTSAISEEKVNLSKAKICQVEDIIESGEDRDTAILLVTDVATMKQFKAKLAVSARISSELERVGCFYEINKRRYLPSDDVKSRCMYDYFNITSSMAVNGLSEKEYSVLLASRFRNVGSIIFVSRRPIRGFSKLIGMKSVSGANQIRSIDIAAGLHDVYGDKIEFYSEYTEQKTRITCLDFDFLCRIEDSCTADGTPLYISLYDNASGRKSIRVNIVVDIEGRHYILNCTEINHRIIKTKEVIAEQISQMLDDYRDIKLNISASTQEIEEACIQYVPKKARQKFIGYITGSMLKPVEAAYDIMETDIFNMKLKVHKTQDYDGGRRKYEIALGSILKKS